MNASDLLIVIALSSGLYALIVAMTRQRQFLARAVNPHRGTWLLAALATVWVGLGLLRWEAGSWSPVRWGPFLHQLITDEPTPPRVKIASMALLLGITFFVLVAWCQVILPRDPSTFRQPEHRRSAVRYYVARLKGGMDYGLLASGDGEVLEEATHLKEVRLRVSLLPKIAANPAEPPRPRTVEDQIESWRQMARYLHERMGDLDVLIERANQGRNRGLTFDAEYGGFFFKYLRHPDPRNKVDSALYVFAATLNQAEMDNHNAERHFHMLQEALENIERSIRG